MHSKLLLILLLVQFSVFGQNQNAIPFKTDFRDVESKVEFSSNKSKGDIPSKAVVLYSNDFTNASQWSFTNNSIPSANWQITTNLNLAPFAAFHPAGFLTGFSGYAIIDSDAQGDSAHQDAYLSLNQRITACANESHVILQFAQMYRKFNDTTTVEVSNNGTTWTQYVVNGNMVNSTNTANPATVRVNITAAAAYQDSVYIRFRYRAKDAWFWAIDEVKLLRQDEFDLVGEKIYYGSEGNWGARIPYTKIPMSQIQPIKISGKVRNDGFSGQGDAKLVANAPGFFAESNPEPVPANFSSTINLLQTWTPSSNLGYQGVNIHVESSSVDAEPGNNTFDSLKVEITSDVYARDFLVKEGRVSNNFNTIGYETGNIFDIYSPETLTSAQVLVLSESKPGSQLFVKIYEALGNNNFVYLSGSDTITIPVLNQNTWFRVRMQNPELLDSAKSYLLVAGSPGFPDFPGLVLGTSGTADVFTSFFLTNSSTDWFMFTEVPMVRMSFESVLEIEKIAKETNELHIYPNPASDKINVRFEAQTQSNVAITVTDMAGKVVLSNTITNVNGDQIVEMNTKELNAGLYMVNVNVNGVNSTKKIAIK